MGHKMIIKEKFKACPLKSETGQSCQSSPVQYNAWNLWYSNNIIVGNNGSSNRKGKSQCKLICRS